MRPAAPWLALAALALATPIGLFAPDWAGAAAPFGEWDSRRITDPNVAGDHALPSAPEGMRRTEGTWSGPLPGYGLPGGPDAEPGAFRRSAGYILSALAGIAAAAAAIYLLGRRWLAAPARGPTDAR
ncbi:MAG: hypothetical protein HZA54_00230 [Planctomycetes bacterium]|nr:hypothetical protein [Planctomycetota bacterium]